MHQYGWVFSFEQKMALITELQCTIYAISMQYTFPLISHRLKDFAKLYDVIKNERNKCVNLIQTSTQKAAEMREKIKILQNEIEILRTAVMQKDR